MTRSLVKTPHSEEFLEYVEEGGIEHFRIIVPAHKNPSSIIPIETLLETLKIILNHSNYPLLIHCNKGKVCIKLPRQLRPHLISSIASNWVHGCLLPETERLDRCRYHHGVRSSRSHKKIDSTQCKRLTSSQVPHLRRGQIPPARRSLHRLLQRRSGPADPRRRGHPLRPSPDAPGPDKAREPAAVPLELPSRVVSRRDRRLGRQPPHPAPLRQIGEELRRRRLALASGPLAGTMVMFA